MSDQQPDRASGGVPHTYRLRMAWRWVPGMPPGLRRRKGFLNALQTLATLADVEGRSRFQDNGQPIRITQLAKAMGSAEKDCRRFLAAAIAAGVLTTEQAPRRGRVTVYVLVVALSPRWDAALAVLTAGGADTEEDTAAVSEFGGTSLAVRTADAGDDTTARGQFGGSSPELDEARQHPSSGDVPPNSTPVAQDRVRVTGTRCGSGDGYPIGSGDGSPNNPGVPTDTPHEMAGEGPQLRDARGRNESHERAEAEPDTSAARSLRSVTGAQSGARTGRPRASVPDGQMPLLMPVPEPHRPQEPPADPGPGDRPIGAPRDGWRRLVAREQPERTAAVFRDRWKGEHARYLPDPTGT